VSGKLHALAALTPGTKLWYPFDRRLGGPQSQTGSCGVEKDLLPLPTIEPRHSLYRLPLALFDNQKRGPETARESLRGGSCQHKCPGLSRGEMTDEWCRTFIKIPSLKLLGRILAAINTIIMKTLQSAWRHLHSVYDRINRGRL
jgi:hypothetical protein